MAYPHYQITVPITTTGGDSVLSANSTAADVGIWLSGPQSYIVRRVAIQRTTTGGWATGAVFTFRKVCGKYASATGGQFAKITLTTGGKREDHLWYNDGFTPTTIAAGRGVTVRLTTASTGKLFRAYILVEPTPEKLSNLSTGNFISVTA